MNITLSLAEMTTVYIALVNQVNVLAKKKDKLQKRIAGTSLSFEESIKTQGKLTDTQADLQRIMSVLDKFKESHKTTLST